MDDLWRDHWRPADVATEAQFLANGVAYLSAVIDGEPHIAPLGSPAPGLTVETVLPST